MSKVRLVISDDRYDMFESAVYIDDAGNEVKLTYFLNSGFAVDSVVVYKQTDLGDFEEAYIHYYPHGKNNDEDNIIAIYAMYCDELEIVNHTKEDLIVNSSLVKVNETIIKKGTNY